MWSSYETNKSQNQTTRSDVKCKVQIWNRSLYNSGVIKISVKKEKKEVNFTIVKHDMLLRTDIAWDIVLLAYSI